MRGRETAGNQLIFPAKGLFHRCQDLLTISRVHLMQMSWEILQVFLRSDKRHGRGEGKEGRPLSMEVHLAARKKRCTRCNEIHTRIFPNYPRCSETPSLLLSTYDSSAGLGQYRLLASGISGE